MPDVNLSAVTGRVLSAVKGCVHEFRDRFGRWGNRNNYQGFSGDGIRGSGFSRLPTDREEAIRMLGEEDDDEEVEIPAEITGLPGVDSEGIIRV